jgi:hypothetical protein
MAMNQPDARPFLVASQKSAVGGAQRFHNMRQQTAKEEVGHSDQGSEARAYRRVAASFAQAKR